jgi:hypothetical protein
VDCPLVAGRGARQRLKHAVAHRREAQARVVLGDGAVALRRADILFVACGEGWVGVEEMAGENRDQSPPFPRRPLSFHNSLGSFAYGLSTRI